MFEAVDGLVAEHAQLEQKLAEPGLHADQALAKRLNQRYAELSAILRAYDDWNRLRDDIEAARELAATIVSRGLSRAMRSPCQATLSSPSRYRHRPALTNGPSSSSA